MKRLEREAKKRVSTTVALQGLNLNHKSKWEQQALYQAFLQGHAQQQRGSVPHAVQDRLKFTTPLGTNTAEDTHIWNS